MRYVYCHRHSGSTGPGLPLSVTLTGVDGSVDLTSASIKRNLNILKSSKETYVIRLT